MDYKDITNLIKLISKSSLSEFKMRDGEFELSIKTDKYQKASKEIRHVTAPSVEMAPAMAPMPSAAPQHDASSEEPSAAPAVSSGGEDSSSDSGLLEIKSPIVGTFYRSPSPDKEAYVKVGDVIDQGSVVCIVEAMKLFNEIESEISGKIVKVVVDDATPVEYDQVLFLVDPNA